MPHTDHTLQLDTPEEGRLLRDFLRESGYERENLAKLLGMVGPPSRQHRNLPLQLHQTREPSRLNTLVRWFIIGTAVEAKAAREVIPEEILRVMEKSGLLVREANNLVPAVLLLPPAGLLLAADPNPESNPRRDLVIGPNAPAHFLSQFTVRRNVRSALDLCCGGGIQALRMASHCETVVASDLNPRALMYARFNARLNGVENIEFVQGDCFNPVRGRRFDLIVSNPPFFLLPANDLLYRDNPMELDSFARELVRQAPAFLNEGGFFQMMFEWAEIEGEPWRQRLTGWLPDSGFDVWIVQEYALEPTEYADTKLRSTDQVSVEDDVETLSGWTEYYRNHKVAAMHGGAITMRKRSNVRSWVDMEEAPFRRGEPFGEMMESFFAAHDLVLDAADEALLNICPRLSPHARLEQVARSSEQGWEEPSMQLRMSYGLERACGVDQQVAAFLSQLNGKRSLRELLALLSPQDGPSADQVRVGCLEVMRRLILRGFVLAE